MVTDFLLCTHNHSPLTTHHSLFILVSKDAGGIPGAVVAELVLDHIQHDGADDRALEGADATNQHHEDHQRGVVDAEDRRRLDEQGVGERHRPGRPGHGR